MFFNLVTNLLSDKVINTTAAAGDLSNKIGNTVAETSNDVSNNIVNGAKASITGVQKCTYQSTFISVVDKNKYGIVTDTLDGLDTVGCICQNEENSSTNEKATKISKFEKNDFTGF